MSNLSSYSRTEAYIFNLHTTSDFKDAKSIALNIRQVHEEAIGPLGRFAHDCLAAKFMDSSFSLSILVNLGISHADGRTGLLDIVYEEIEGEA